MYDRDALLKDLRQYVIEVTFNKVDGTQRIMRCTLRPDLLPPTYQEDITEERQFHKENKDVISAWDVHKNNWRSFRINSVTYVQNVNDNY